MSALAFDQKIVVDKNGAPLEVIIPYAKFIEWVETYGLDLSDEDLEGIREAEADRSAGNKEAFVSLAQIKQELVQRED